MHDFFLIYTIIYSSRSDLMNLNFIINDYILIWNVLFQASVSEPIYKLKQKLWDTYKEQYNNTYKDRVAILNDVKNYIPNDDTIYNII